MSARKPLLPRLESLEAKTAMSAGASTAPAAIVSAAMGLAPGTVRPPLSSHGKVTDLAAMMAEKVELSGHAKGFYTSRLGPPDTGTQFRVNAIGLLTPIGSAVIAGSFHTVGFIDGGVATGTLTVTGPKGKLHLILTEAGAVGEGISTDTSDPINPGGPMIPASPRTSGATTGEPIILVNTFRFVIKSGTGQYTHDRGNGTVQIETTPALSIPTGPGIYSSSLAIQAGTGRTILTFTPERIPSA
jgi:hypothetical protein